MFICKNNNNKGQRHRRGPRIDTSSVRSRKIVIARNNLLT